MIHDKLLIVVWWTMLKTQKQTQIHAHECSLSPPLFPVRCCVVVLRSIVRLLSLLSVYLCCMFQYVLLLFPSAIHVNVFCLFTVSCVICRFSCSSWRVFASQTVTTWCGGCVLCCVVSVGLCWCKRVCVCMYVSVGCVCERSQVCWCTTHTLNTRHTHLTHHTHHTHPHGVKGCVMCCIVQRCGKQQQTHNTTTHHHHHHKHITTQHDTHNTAWHTPHSMTHKGRKEEVRTKFVLRLFPWRQGNDERKTQDTKRVQTVSLWWEPKLVQWWFQASSSEQNTDLPRVPEQDCHDHAWSQSVDMFCV